MRKGNREGGREPGQSANLVNRGKGLSVYSLYTELLVVIHLLCPSVRLLVNYK